MLNQYVGDSVCVFCALFRDDCEVADSIPIIVGQVLQTASEILSDLVDGLRCGHGDVGGEARQRSALGLDAVLRERGFA